MSLIYGIVTDDSLNDFSLVNLMFGRKIFRSDPKCFNERDPFLKIGYCKAYDAIYLAFNVNDVLIDSFNVTNNEENFLRHLIFMFVSCDHISIISSKSQIDRRFIELLFSVQKTVRQFDSVFKKD
ncbi:hypothetical protein MHBO_001826 [Bonamia ostreae]|uniref:Uncharacterized protein n=1 Tax=Bonamia ostreae TaxID=126728 RepID=A0ABV2AKB5_9EUKA